MTKDLRSTIDAARGGDAPSLNALFARNIPRLEAYLRIQSGRLIGTKESISDLAQSVCREVLRDIDQFEYRDEAGFRQWLFKQAARKVVDKIRYYRRKQRDASREQGRPARDEDTDCVSAIEVYATLVTPSQHASARELLERIQAALDALPESQREAVGMVKLLDMSYAEAASHMSVSESAVRNLVARGLATIAPHVRPDMES